MHPLLSLRNARAVTQGRIASLAGVSLRTVWRIENDEGSPQLQNVAAILIALHKILPLSPSDVDAVARHCALPRDMLASSVGFAAASVPPPSSAAETQSKLMDKLRVAIAELGAEVVDKCLNDLLVSAFVPKSTPATEPPTADRLLTVASPPRPSPLGPGIVEQTYRHYSPVAPSAPPAAAPLPKPAAAPHPKRRPG